ncbi:MAG: AraC family transcriptional regulator ligand-binding domain-containing protein [Halieaceae bacterium]
MATKFLVPARKFLRLLDYMERIGLDPEAMLAPLDLSRRQLLRLPEDHRLSGADYSAMYRNAVQQMQTLKRPIPWAAGMGSEAFELMCHCIIGGKTLGDALALAQRYDHMLYPMLGYRMRLQLVDDKFELHYRVRLDPNDKVFAPEGWDRAEHQQSVSRASGLMVWYGLCGWLIGRSIDLEEVQIAAPHVSDAYRDGLSRVFNCPLKFESSENKFVASRDYLERRLVHSNESLQAFLKNVVYELSILSSKPASTTAAIRSLIKLDFSEGIPSFEQMAHSLHMSESSLRRRLLKEETSYQSIKDQVRCEIAIEHLGRDDTRINDLAELLGFTEPSSFVRSFRGWMGVTPKAYRDSLNQAGGA